MQRIQRVLARARLGEAGQALVLFAAAAAFSVGALGLSIDVGRIVVTRTQLQAAADAAALAGGQDLSEATLAFAIPGLRADHEEAVGRAVDEYIRKNLGANVSYTWSLSMTYAENDTLTVTVQKDVNHALLKLFGVDKTTVKARAATRKNGYSGGTGVMPWGFIAAGNDPTSTLLQNSCFDGWETQGGNEIPKFKMDQDCTMKFGAGTSSGGDFASLAIDGTGASIYRQSVIWGAQTPLTVGMMIDPETGNMRGPTREGVDTRLAQPAPAGCPGNAMSQMLIDNPNGTKSIVPQCERSARILILPVVDRINNPNKSKVLGFAFMYLKGYSNAGGHTQIIGRFVRFESELPNSIYELSRSNAMVVKFVE